MSSLTLDTDRITTAMDLLGGARTFQHVPVDALEVHAAIQSGFPGGALTELVANVPVVADPAMLDRAVGVSVRTLQRRKSETNKSRLSLEQSARAWKFAEIVAKATAVLGSQGEAERWLETPAIGLDQQRPIDLLTTPVGTELVEQFLERLEYGVYV